MTASQYTKWIIFWVVVVGTIVFIICGCAGGGNAYRDPAETLAQDYGAVSGPTNDVSQDVWVRRLGQPDELVTVMPAY